MRSLTGVLRLSAACVSVCVLVVSAHAAHLTNRVGRFGTFPDAPMVALDYITLAGTVHNGVEMFKGIPYAAPPVGELRFRPPQPPLPHAGIFNASEYGHACHGAASTTTESEDCLLINVFRPAGTKPLSNVPVFVYVHGGGFTSGASQDFDGESFVRDTDGEFIYVVFNYRLGVFGFMSNPQLLAEGHGANFGLLDHEAAFLWVKKYIALFGGNADDVATFGESAGAIALAIHMVAYGGQQKLFTRAIVQSGSVLLNGGIGSAEKQAEATAKVAAAIGCSAPLAAADAPEFMRCLRAANATALQAAGAGGYWFPVVDGHYVADEPATLMRRGRFSPVPAIFGHNTNEGTFFSDYNLLMNPTANFAAAVAAKFPFLSAANITTVQQLYAADDFDSPFYRMAEMEGDDLLICPSEEFAQLRVQYIPQVPTYRYRFNHVMVKPYVAAIFRVCHAEELRFLLNMTDVVQPQEYPFTAKLQHAWANFAAHADPSADNYTWPLYGTAHQQTVLEDAFVVETEPAVHAARCAFWIQKDKEALAAAAAAAAA